ncbi:hypothetical protein DYBT9275_03150 [Dyadobacter sp. CECT 9275]|uniref:N-acetyltransferase domain-containing protein n=1 Tax=Dyadobacter helix TaxID=2822344 RepID=A0A916JDG1_9BACT|nr:GNAT family N-acetyltransferase [Dyadobacter sp. CECT 9275]CAG5003425.1 hypothetical protein DYBT9275_03150 [Dyadobacter sp. CECT 9275]
MNPAPVIIKAENPDHYSAGLVLFKAYITSLDFDLSFQNIDQELQILPEMYGAPTGALLLVVYDNQYIGVAGIRRIENEFTCEVKRMYIRPEYQGKGMGKELMSKIMEVAREMNYRKIKLDTHAVKMPHAVKLYEASGFRQVAPYNYNPHPGTVFFERDL